VSPALVLIASSLAAVAAAAAAAVRPIRRRGLDRWLVPYVLRSATRAARRGPGSVHVLLCIADHFEPLWGKADPETARRRVDDWVTRYPRLFASFRDHDGRPPRHSFFFPIDEYVPEHVDALAGLCRAGFGEVELHLHHDGDSSKALRERLLAFKALFAERHGVLPRDRATGATAYGFIHGNWALDNSRPDGRWCGVNDELDVLRETGCYADFTLPSYPSPTQTRKVNSVYYATDDPHRPRSHDTGVDVGSGPAPAGALMLIQGPLAFDWTRRKAGVLPRIENGCLQASQPPHVRRLEAWLRACVRVPTRPDWFFVKLHTHGATEANREVLLGEPMVEFHRALARRATVDPNFHVHYVTAREMYNLARAAEAGWKGSVADARDFQLVWDGARAPGPALAVDHREAIRDQRPEYKG
jgi:hypothetical protein